jgi:hypothetical protein
VEACAAERGGAVEDGGLRVAGRGTHLLGAGALDVGGGAAGASARVVGGRGGGGGAPRLQRRGGLAVQRRLVRIPRTLLTLGVSLERGACIGWQRTPLWREGAATAAAAAAAC